MTQYDILNDIKADLHKERLQRFFHKYWKHLLAISGAIVVGVAVYAFMNFYRVQDQEKISTSYFRLNDSKSDATKYKLALEEFINSTKASSAYVDIAKLELSEVLKHAKEYDKAALTLQDLIASSKRPHITNIATVRLAELVLNHNLGQHRLKAIQLLDAKCSTPCHTRKLMLAQLFLASNDSGKAKDVLTELLNDSSTPEEIRFVSKLLLEVPS
jgi:hypothetical protein